MKKLSIVATLALATGLMMFQSCDKIKDALKANVTVKAASGETTVQPITDLNGLHVLLIDSADFDADKAIRENTEDKLNINNIKSAKVKKCVLTIVNPDNDNNWANFESGKLHFHVNNTAPEVVIDISNPDEYKDKLEIPAEKFPADMIPYVKGTKAYWTRIYPNPGSKNQQNNFQKHPGIPKTHMIFFIIQLITVNCQL